MTRPVGEAREGPGGLAHAARHGEALAVAQGRRHGQMGELRVKVPQVSGATLWEKKHTLVWYGWFLFFLRY